MDFKCPLCDKPIPTLEKLKQHIKNTHSAYFCDTYLFPSEMLFPGVSSSVAPNNVELPVITSEPISTPEVAIEQVEESCCVCCEYGGTEGEGAGLCDCNCEDDTGAECDDCLVM
ncbi:uncharacterized protein LOC129723516 [Wyeomyia smithii]|uniref:uncharacterized protein LOC129723516 n=1 Tax=Wyeomyia smithii TaxID=174621 RepID=UPI002467BC97|nr:uncharacterized protein LOC129723516 [Wyeomyia smithii]XP_055533757.1 uncharacterized protein LOC129723516 [Wyeomyia smithii]